MNQANASSRDAATHTSPASLAEGDMPEQDGSEDPGPGLQFLHDVAPQQADRRSQSASTLPSAVKHGPIHAGLPADGDGQQLMSFRVADVRCSHCIYALTRAIRATDANAGVEVDLDEYVVRVASALAGDDIAAAIREAGYDPASVPPTGNSSSLRN